MGATEDTSLFDYRSGEHLNVNGKLRGSETRQDHLADEIIEELTNVIDRTIVPEDMVVFRGTALPNSVVDRMIETGSFRDNGFVSTSLNTKIAGDFSDFAGMNMSEIDMIIKVPKGSKGLYVPTVQDNVLPGLDIDAEWEFLLPPGTEFNLIDADVDFSSAIGEGTITLEVVQ